MLTKKSIKKGLRQVSALVEKNLYLATRFKTAFLLRFLNPIIQVLMPLIIFGTIFSISEDYNFGYWRSDNYILFMMLAFCIQFLRQIIDRFFQMLLQEKFWKTLQSFLVAPLNMFTYLVGLLVSELILISIPFIVFLLLAWILFPIPFMNFLLILLLFLAISLIFGSIGLLVSVFAITNESIGRISQLCLKFLFWLSCYSYPLQIFPVIIQYFIILNPLYYIFDLIRLSWYMAIDPEIALIYITPAHITIIILLTLMTPIIAIYLFNKLYKKYGISGY